MKFSAPRDPIFTVPTTSIVFSDDRILVQSRNTTLMDFFRKDDADWEPTVSNTGPNQRLSRNMWYGYHRKKCVIFVRDLWFSCHIRNQRSLFRENDARRLAIKYVLGSSGYSVRTCALCLETPSRLSLKFTRPLPDRITFEQPRIN